MSTPSPSPSPVTRTGYTDPDSGLPRSGSTARSESLVDLTQYAQPLEQLHAGALHGWGIATGLEVTTGTDTVTVSPGVALDAHGRHLALTAGGRAKTSDTDLLDVTDTGVTLPRPTGGGHLTLAWAETFDRQTYAESQFTVFQIDHTPWLRWQDPATFTDDGTDLVLATLTPAGATEPGPRRGTTLPTAHLALHRPTRDGDTIRHTPAGDLTAHPDGGLHLRVSRPGDQIHIGLHDAPSTLRIDAATGNLAAGTDTAPRTALHLPERGLQIGTSTTPTDNFHLTSDNTTGPRALRLYNGDHGTGTPLLTTLPTGQTGIGTTVPLGRLHVRDVGGFGEEGGDGALAWSNVPLLAQADTTAFGILNGQGRPAFALNIDGNGGTTGARGIPTFYDRFDGNWHACLSLQNGQVGVGTTAPLGRLHAQHTGGFGDENGDGVLAWSNVPLLAHSDSTAFGIVNAQGRPAFALNIDGNGGTTGARGIPTFYDRFDGNWRQGLSLRNGFVGMGIYEPTARLDVRGPGNVFGIQSLHWGSVAAIRAQNGADGPAISAEGASGHGVSARSDTGYAVCGISRTSNGVAGVSSDGNGVYAMGGGSAGHFQGNVTVTGTLFKSGGQFRIDHPLDPAGRYLSHSFVESSEMKNVYDGVVTLDADGAAEVVLADWCEALNESFRYQLTPLGAAAPALHVAAQVSGDRFRIAGGEPGMQVSWQLTGVRRDAYALAHPLTVDEEKPPAERGYYLHPELYDQPVERDVEWARQPRAARLLTLQMRRMAIRARIDQNSPSPSP